MEIRRKRSVVWCYFTPTTPGNAMCSICHKDVRHCNNTSNLFKHLKSTHPFTYEEAERRNDASQKTLLPSASQKKFPPAPRKTIKKCKSEPAGCNGTVGSGTGTASAVVGGIPAVRSGTGTMHITIQRGRSLPQLVLCHKCCDKLYHCPFCQPLMFQPTRLCKVETHLQSHFNKAVSHEGYTIHRCGLQCKQKRHYHCVHCKATLFRKEDFTKHLVLCKEKYTAVTTSTAVRAITVPVPLLTAGTPPTTALAVPVPLPTVPLHPAGTLKEVHGQKNIRKCEICHIELLKKNFRKHFERKHIQKTKKDITGNYHLRKQSPTRDQHIKESLVKMIVSNLTPVSIVENVGFCHFVKVLNPSFHIPDEKSLMEKEIPQLYEKVQTVVKQSLDFASSVVLTTDMWTSNRNESFLSVSGHFVDQNWKMEACNLLTAPLESQHTADDVSELLTQLSNDWGIANKIHAVVTFNNANLISAVKKCQWEHVMCFAHTLDLLVKDAIKADTDLTPTLEKCCAIVAFFHQNSKASDMLKEVQCQLQMPEEKLIKGVETRWNSVLYMLKRLYDQQQAVVTALCLVGKNTLCLTEEEWSKISETIRALKPFDEAAQEVLEEQSVTVSKVLPLVCLLQKATSSAGLHNNRLASVLATQCKQHFQKFEQQSTIECSTFLDPRFKNLVFIDAGNVEMIKLKLINEMQSLSSSDDHTSSEVPIFIVNSNAILEGKSPTKNTELSRSSCSTSSSGLWQEFDTSIVASRDKQNVNTNPHNEMSRFMEERLIPRSEDPLLWWKNNAEMYPLLSKLAKKYLGTVATSVPAQRLLSDAGETLNQKRNAIEPKNINMLLFLNSNLNLE